MSVVEIKDQEDFRKKIEKGKLLIDFFAPWCGPCKMLSPELDKLSNDIEFDILKINIDSFPDLASQYKILSVPTLLLLKDGLVISTSCGVKTKQELLLWVEEEFKDQVI